MGQFGCTKILVILGVLVVVGISSVWGVRVCHICHEDAVAFGFSKHGDLAMAQNGSNVTYPPPSTNNTFKTGTGCPKSKLLKFTCSNLDPSSTEKEYVCVKAIFEDEKIFKTCEVRDPKKHMECYSEVSVTKCFCNNEELCNASPGALSSSLLLLFMASFVSFYVVINLQ